MPRLKKFDELNKNTINSIKTDNVWVVMNIGITDIYEIFLNKNDAERTADNMNKDIYDYYRKINKNMNDEEFDQYHKASHRLYNVMSLYDAIDSIKDTVYDDASDPGEEY